MEVVNSQATLLEAFKIADSVLTKGTKAIADLITTAGLINLDFADIKSVMSNAGSALMGVGEAEGANKAQDAVEAAIDSPLVEVNIDGARGVLINITGGPDITMAEIEESAKTITSHVAPDANVIFGASIDPDLTGKIKVTVIATGFDPSKNSAYSSYKKPQALQKPLINVDTDVSTNENDTQKEIDPHLKNLMADQEIPAGVEIENEFDIPAFLRKNN
jgi:cell division protein FtsZ